MRATAADDDGGRPAERGEGRPAGRRSRAASARRAVRRPRAAPRRAPASWCRHRSRSRRRATRRSPPSAVQITTTASRAASQRDHRAGREREAEVAADGGDVLDLPRHQERVRALAAPARRPAPRERPGPARPCRSRRCAARRAAPPSPASRACVRSTRPLTAGCGSEKSQVPPASRVSPGASTRSSRPRASTVAGDGGEVHHSTSASRSYDALISATRSRAGRPSVERTPSASTLTRLIAAA